MAQNQAPEAVRPKISGFTLVRNGTRFDYPYLESMASLMPLVDELVVNVGRGDDDTLQQVKRFSILHGGDSKVKIFESDWPLNDPEKKKGGQILAEQTNLALDQCTGDWCVYLQADEVLHHEDLSNLRRAISQVHPHPVVDGLVFDYLHFYGSYDVVQFTRSAYRREVRAIRRGSGARSIGDAQSFRMPDGSKPRVLEAGARIFHYGWVRTPDAMKAKTFFMDTLYHGDPNSKQAAEGTPHSGDNYRYKKIWGLQRFRHSHPGVMDERIRAKNWNWDLENSPLEWSWKDAKKIILDLVERWSGRRFFEYRSYRELK
jgi:glycosyltransferase involved in cell wall biosynthesis